MVKFAVVSRFLMTLEGRRKVEALIGERKNRMFDMRIVIYYTNKLLYILLHNSTISSNEIFTLPL